MPSGRKISVWIRLAAWLILLIGAILVCSLLFVNYSAWGFLVLGFLLAWPAKTLLRLAANRMRTWGNEQWFRLIAILVALLAMVASQLVFWPFAPPMPPVVFVKEYRVAIEAIESNLSEFQAREQAILFSPSDEEKTWTVTLPARQVTGANRGLLLRELSIAPLQNASLSGVVLRTDTCSSASAELTDFPRGSFYAARDAEKLKRYPYVDTETITWSIRSLRRGVVFSYILPPFQHLRPILAPFIGVTSLSQWVIGLLGFIGAIALTPIVKPVLLEIAKKRFKSWMEKEPSKSPKRTVPLIVSGKGEEKEIEISEDKH
jgi:hypothetical protein